MTEGEKCLRRAYEAILASDFESAVDWFAQAVEAEPDNASYYYKGSISLARSGKLEMALDYARSAVRLAPDEADYRLHLRLVEGRKLARQARALLAKPQPEPDTAIELLREAVVLDPLDAGAYLLLGIACRLAGEYDRAIEALRAAKEMNPMLAEAGRLLRETKMDRARRWRLIYTNHTRRKNR
ncbi:tetratricopeptide repeat protein [Cohnella sp. JJ-181]|uniref:tetratricopeptide repeat protein n=1 Tax=Cohnella rhizoplanae TaxID=2974897 RepID=UPI0022FF5DC5|nr:tetratricopeptide repeat protein [Cohnella sp. JJ-181]CAI6080998.1 hypothetical protein COHCIP112018_03165 [Cohnella sp. JJ-181]